MTEVALLAVDWLKSIYQAKFESFYLILVVRLKI